MPVRLCARLDRRPADHQLDALRRAGVARENIFVEHASGRESEPSEARGGSASASRWRHAEDHGWAVPSDHVYRPG
jgi:hypothetical protein